MYLHNGLRQMGQAGAGAFPIPPTFAPFPQTLLEPLRVEVRALLDQIPPELHATAVKVLTECNIKAAQGKHEQAMDCLTGLRNDLALKAEAYQKIPAAPKRGAEAVLPWVLGGVGAAVLLAIFVP